MRENTWQPEFSLNQYARGKDCLQYRESRGVIYKK